MRIHQIYLVLTLAAIGLTALSFVLGMQHVDWNASAAWRDFIIFIDSAFGKVVMLWLLMTGLALTVFATHEAMYRREYRLLWIIPVMLVLSVGVALPLYLYLRTPKRDE